MTKKVKRNLLGRKWTEDALNSEYQKQYIEKTVPFDGYVKKPHGELDKHPFDGRSTYTDGYKSWDPQHTASAKPALQEKENLPFTAASCYQAEFAPKEVAYVRVHPNPHIVKTEGPFETKTSQRDAYKDWGPQELRNPLKANSNVSRSMEPFTAHSLYTDEFKAKAGVQLVVPVRPGTSGVHPNAPLDPTTTYSTSFVPKALNRLRASNPAFSYSPGVWADGPPASEYKGHFDEKAMAGTLSLKPPLPDKFFAGSFDPSTNYNSDFRKWSTAPARSLKPTMAPLEARPFDAHTTYGDQYMKKDIPYLRVKAVAGGTLVGGPFDGNTTNRDDYKLYTPKAVTYVKGPRPRLEPQMFEGRTTYSDEYIKKAGELTGMIRPKETGPMGGLLDGLTTYRKDYVPKELPARESNAVEFEDNADDDGNDFY